MRPEPEWTAWFDELAARGRAASVRSPDGPLWLATERRASWSAVSRRARGAGRAAPGDARGSGTVDEETAAVAVARGHLAALGPTTAAALAARTALSAPSMDAALARLEAEGFALRGHFDPERSRGDVEFCERRLLARIHRYTTDRLRREIEPVTAQDFMRFLLRWQHVAPETQREGARGVLAAIEQLQGFEIAAGSWEESVLPPASPATARSGSTTCASRARSPGAGSRPAAGGSEAPREEGTGRGGAAPSRATPVTLALRDDLPWLLRAARGTAQPARPGDGRGARHPRRAPHARRALLQTTSPRVTGRLRIEVEEGLWDLVVARARHGRRIRQRARAPDRAGTLRPSARRTRAGAGCARARARSPWARRAAGRSCTRRNRCRATSADVESSPRRWPSSCSRATAWSSGTWRCARRSRCRGARCSGRCGAWRRAAPSAAAGSSPGSSASSTRCPRPSRRCARPGAASAPERSSASPRSIR